MDFPQLIGPSYTTWSPKAEIQSCKNLYLERIESGAGRNRYAMYMTFGTEVWHGALGSTNRGFLLDPTNNHLFALQDSTVYDLLSDGTTNASYAGVSDDGLMASIDATSNSLFIVSKNILYRVFGGALTTPATPFTPEAVAVINGIVVTLAAGTNRFYFSNDDGATWGALDFQTAEAYPNTLINMVVDHQELWLFGNRRTQVFVVGLDPDAPFDPVSSGVIEMGLAAKRAVVRMDNSIYWLGRNKDGDHMVYRANGYLPVRVSTHAVENAFRSYSEHEDAFMQAFQLNGHSCFRLTFPSANNGLGATWQYDASLPPELAWVEVPWWNLRQGQYERNRANGIVSAFGKILVGDYANGHIYEMSPDFAYDWGFPLRWERRCPHITQDRKRIRYQRFDLFIQPGVGRVAPLWLNSWSLDPATFASDLAAAVFLGSVTSAQAVTLQRIYDYLPYTPLDTWPSPDVMNALGFYPWGSVSSLSNGTTLGDPPQLAARWSDDGGETFGAYQYRSMGLSGEYSKELSWLRCGMGFDRVWEISGDAPVKTAIVQGTFDAEVCQN